MKDIAQDIASFFRKHPIPAAIALVAAFSGAGLVVAQLTSNPDLAEELIKLSTNLIFLGLIGGLLKILLDDYSKGRQERADYATFIANILDDLKGVHDRVERVRIVIPAHRSAKTYGDEMRDLIDARVTLKNVIRAVETRPVFQDEIRALDCQKKSNDCKASLEVRTVNDTGKVPLIEYVVKMQNYLEGLTNEFVAEYKPFADRQRVYEKHVNDVLERRNKLLSSEQPSEETSFTLKDSIDTAKELDTYAQEFVWGYVDEKSYLFGVGLELVSDLDSRTLSSALRREFGNTGYDLSPEAQVKIDRPENEWTIVDIIMQYKICKDGDRLNVYKKGFPRLRELIGSGKADCATSYHTQFIGPLDQASCILRAKLQEVYGYHGVRRRGSVLGVLMVIAAIAWLISGVVSLNLSERTETPTEPNQMEVDPSPSAGPVSTEDPSSGIGASTGLD